MIVPFSPGGATDVLARLIGERLKESWKQPVVIENRLGASGNIGANAVAKAPPDGYTLLMGAIGTNAVNAALFESMPYDTARDFAPVTQVARLPMLLAVHPSVPAKTAGELVALAKEKPGSLNHGSAGKGASQHLAALLFEAKTGTKLEHVFYRGAAAMVPDLLSGRVHLTFGDMASILPYVKSGELRALAVTTAQRSPLLPDVPSLAEAGIPGYEAAAWYGMFAPAGTPRPILDKLNAEVVRIIRAPDMLERLGTLGAEPVGSQPDAFAGFVRDEMQRWGAIVRQAAVKPD
jgi:tripartite-type tricarboxylate transporter receptor subunit TctC